MRIGKLKLNSNVIMAPMAGVNCTSFRLICHEYGAGLVSTPMIYANNLVARPERVIKKTCFLKKEKPISVQLVGADTENMKEAAIIIEKYADVIDVNLGCPDRKIIENKAGGFFSKHPEQIDKIVKPVIDNTNKPVTAKIRTGWNGKSINTLKTIKILNDLGVDAITIHARNVKQGYSGKADLNEIKKAKQTSKVLIIGNGDIFSPDDAKSMIEKTKCDGVMVGRGCIGNPFIFKRINSLLKDRKNTPEPNGKDKKKAFFKFLNYYEKYENNRNFTEIKQHAMRFTKGVSKNTRYNLTKTKSIDEIKNIYEDDLR
ncbi:MAG: tRNA dihydrouridine synthase DusB [Candidatus Nanoarchaeia archaeon]|nr:tRNA dihydrouridine synthase DusB [Candidatus Nanoarchaeia archaeon]